MTKAVYLTMAQQYRLGEAIGEIAAAVGRLSGVVGDADADFLAGMEAAARQAVPRLDDDGSMTVDQAKAAAAASLRYLLEALEGNP